MNKEIWEKDAHEAIENGSKRVHYTVEKIDDGNKTIYILLKDHNPISISAVAVEPIYRRGIM